MIKNMSKQLAKETADLLDVAELSQCAKVSSHRTNGVLHWQVNVTYEDRQRKPYSIGHISSRNHT